MELDNGMQAMPAIHQSGTGAQLVDHKRRGRAAFEDAEQILRLLFVAPAFALVALVIVVEDQLGMPGSVRLVPLHDICNLHLLCLDTELFALEVGESSKDVFIRDLSSSAVVFSSSLSVELVQPTRLGGSAASRKKSRKSGVPARSETRLDGSADC